MNFGNSVFDLAEMRVEQEREAAIKAASVAVKATGARDCEDCPNEISSERRRAMPSATRCIQCQTRFEGRSKRGRA